MNEIERARHLAQFKNFEGVVEALTNAITDLQEQLQELKNSIELKPEEKSIALADTEDFKKLSNKVEQLSKKVEIVGAEDFKKLSNKVEQLSKKVEIIVNNKVGTKLEKKEKAQVKNEI